jgi:hypothetical protein
MAIVTGLLNCLQDLTSGLDDCLKAGCRISRRIAPIRLYKLNGSYKNKERTDRSVLIFHATFNLSRASKDRQGYGEGLI